MTEYSLDRRQMLGAAVTIAALAPALRPAIPIRRKTHNERSEPSKNRAWDDPPALNHKCDGNARNDQANRKRYAPSLFGAAAI